MERKIKKHLEWQEKQKETEHKLELEAKLTLQHERNKKLMKFK